LLIEEESREKAIGEKRKEMGNIKKESPGGGGIPIYGKLVTSE